MSDYEPANAVRMFFGRLGRLDAGGRARLKRAAGQGLAESRGSLGLFYSVLPAGIPAHDEETYFLAATLFPIADGGGQGDLGAALRRARNDRNAKGVDRRMHILLDSDADQLPFRLRQTVTFLQSCRVRVDWPRLLDDLLHWRSPRRHVQRRWARSYYAK